MHRREVGSNARCHHFDAAMPTTPPHTLAPAFPVVRDSSWPPCADVMSRAKVERSSFIERRGEIDVWTIFHAQF